MYYLHFLNILIQLNSDSEESEICIDFKKMSFIYNIFL